MPLDEETRKEVEKRIRRSVMFQELFRGTGEEVLDEINMFAGMKNDTFDKDPYEHAYNAGRRSVAIFINNVINQNVKEVREALKEAAKGDSNA